jgi:F-type H+-transporting ATPase subunit epsilon
MNIRVLLPAEVFLEEEVSEVKAEAPNGWFGLLPHHIDFATALLPGILVLKHADKPEEYLAIDHGILVKRGPEVSISTRSAARGTSLEHLKQAVVTEFQAGEQREKKAMAHELKLEAELVRALMELSKNA